MGALKHDLLTSEEFKNDPDYLQKLEDEMNDVAPETISAVQELLQDIKDNAYSFETDSGKADMITGKVVANYQWSGDAVYTMDQAEEDDFYLEFAIPEEATNIYFDGWVMLKKGIRDNADKKHAAQAFMNFISRPDNVVRNMYYIGYTSVIGGSEEDQRIFEYLDWCYGAEDDEEEAVDYPLGYFFNGDNSDENYVICAPAEQMKRQLYAQYPTEDVINRSSIMIYFDKEANDAINQMWINVRCYNIHDVPMWAWAAAVISVIVVVLLLIKAKRRIQL